MRLLEISVGPQIAETIALSKTTTVTPIGSLGALSRVSALMSLLDEKTRALLEGHLSEFSKQAALADPAIITEIVVPDGVIEPAPGRWEREARLMFERARLALTLAYGGGFYPFCEIMIQRDVVALNMTFPRALGLTFEGVEKRDKVGDAKTALGELRKGDRYGFLLGLYDSATRQEDVRFRTAHLFTCLEALAAGRFVGTNGSADNIRMMLRYGHGMPFPRFQIGAERAVELDHIAVARFVRDALFHGLEKEPKDDIKPGLAFYERKPDLVAFALACDCWRILIAGEDTRPSKPEPALPWSADPNGYRFHVATETRPNGHCVGVLIRRGELRGQVYIAGWFRDFAGGGLGPFKVAVPPGSGPISPADEFGYLLEVATPENS